MSSLRIAIACFIFFAPSACFASEKSSDDLFKSIYTNVKYGYSICYPKGIMSPQGEAENSDGQSFRSSDGSEMRVFGRYDISAKSIDKVYYEELRDLHTYKSRVSYQIKKESWAVFSGTEVSGDIFYEKIIKKDDKIVEFVFRNHEKDASKYQYFPRKFISCFKVF